MADAEQKEYQKETENEVLTPFLFQVVLDKFAQRAHAYCDDFIQSMGDGIQDELLNELVDSEKSFKEFIKNRLNTMSTKINEQFRGFRIRFDNIQNQTAPNPEALLETQKDMNEIYFMIYFLSTYLRQHHGTGRR